jgi:3-deoxy-manno-octulosonate cytidylyltransferase (CMP-KDO synthetase)
MRTVIIIPARYASTRYPGKPLAMLTLPDWSRKSLIELTWDAAQQVSGIDAVYVATDDDQICAAAEAFGANVIMTSDTCENGTERCAEAVSNKVIQADIVVNLQGDAPLTPPWFIEALVDEMKRDFQVQMATPVLRCDPRTYAHFIEDRKNGRVGGTTATFDRNHNALYFSKEVIPYIDPNKAISAPVPVFHHVGVYAYRPTALAAYKNWSHGPLELLEGLEQQRFLENGYPIRCVEVDAKGRVFWELNNLEDIPRIEAAYRDLT